MVNGVEVSVCGRDRPAAFPGSVPAVYQVTVVKSTGGMALLCKLFCPRKGSFLPLQLFLVFSFMVLLWDPLLR